jgi:hypothetical protein
MVIVTGAGSVGGMGVGGGSVAPGSVGLGLGVGVGVAAGAHPVSTMANTTTKTTAVVNHLRIAFSSLIEFQVMI